MTGDDNQKRPEPFVYDHPYQQGQDPAADAWYTAFFLENHLDYYAYPEHVATEEQVRFMVYTEENERYYPCSDRMFWTIMRREYPPFLKEKYEEVLSHVLELIERQIEDPWEKRYLKALINTKFEHETRDGMMIPSRIEKRLLKIYLNRTQIEDPYLCEKAQRNAQACMVLKSDIFKDALDCVDDSVLLSSPVSLEQIKERVDYLKLRRLFALSVETGLWETEEMSQYTGDDYLRLFNRPLTGDGVERLWDFLDVGKGSHAATGVNRKRILWLANEAGEIVVDLAIIRYLARLGHKIIIVFKDGPLFTKVDFLDAQEDKAVSSELESGLLIKKKDMGKNELVNTLKSDKSIMAISDGTRENLNLLLSSTTFARVFKEVDGVISKGLEQRRRLFDTHFRFTQDIYSIAKDEKGLPSIWYKARHPAVIKFTHQDLEQKAQAIISKMEEAKKGGMTVVFYSGIIGSIPGKVAMAKKIMSTHVKFLKEQFAETFIINPSEYFEPGMDADDLMFMWEIVQRSGFIDIWRFQTYDDIVQAFGIMNTKVPPEWVGKDATFSTGCTKEMRIALDVQMEHPEMQIIGPSQERFLRRKEYGIGKMYDRRLSEICAP
ncbi:MAG: ARMT1-like domain-containing protein [Thermodesulfobacteriota bacterium]|nr:ARMT1-like domain-containing protein [Thermodesulfobacteriota bacterium]